MVALLEMRNTVRRLTARYSEESMTDAQVDRYINLFYTLHFPEHFKTLKLTKPLVFLTTPNVDTYCFVYQNGLSLVPAGNAAGDPTVGSVLLTPPVYCQGYLLRYYQDKTNFYNTWPKLSVNQQVAVGDGTAVSTGTIPSFPFLRAQADIFGNITEAAVIFSAVLSDGTVYTLTDVPIPGTNTGNLVNPAGDDMGDVNYLTGVYTATFDGNITGGIPIYASVVPYQASRPTDVIFYNQQITLRPVPAQVYQMEFQISQQPTDLIGDGAAPELDEWYLFICAGAAKLIYADFPDPDGMQYLMPIFQEQLQIAQRRTLKQMGSQRAQTIFSGYGRPNLAGYFYGSSYSGN